MYFLLTGPRGCLLRRSLHAGLCWDSFRQILSCASARIGCLAFLKQMRELLAMSLVRIKAAEAGCSRARVS